MLDESPITLFLRKYKKLLIALLVIIVLLIMGRFGYILWMKQSRGTLVVIAAPPDLTLSIDGKKFSEPGTLYVSEGSYDLTFTRKDFSTSKQKVTLTKGKKSEVEVVLYPVTPEGLKYLEKNPDVQLLSEKIGGRIESRENAQLVKDYPLIKKLPTAGLTYKINYAENPDTTSNTKIVIKVDYGSVLGRDQANQWIKDQGFKLEDYTILYNDLSKPQYSELD